MMKLGRVKFRIKDFVCEFMGATPDELKEQDLKEAREVLTLSSLPSNQTEQP